MAVRHTTIDAHHAPGADDALGTAPPVSAGPQPCAAWLSRVLDRQLELFGSLDTLSKAQSASVASGDTDTLLNILARREDIIRAIVSLSERVAPINATWPDLASVLPQAQRVELRRRIDAIDHAVREIAKRDDADRSALERERGSIADELVSMGRVRGAVNAYAPAKPIPGPRFQDQTG